MADDRLTLADFQPLVGSRFWLQREDAPPLAAALVEARPAAPAGVAARRPFNLTFEAPAEPLLAQRTYQLTHPALGTLDIFLVPVARSATGLSYEAVFS